MLTIYTPQKTERIAFIMNLFFNRHAYATYRLTDSKDDLHEATHLITYAPQPLSIENEVFIWQHPLMTSTGIQEQTIDMGMFEGEPVFFQSPHDQSFLPFDIFALSFYLLTRYEEYLPHRKDVYGRFPASESLAFKQGFLHKPLVDVLVLKFVRKLKDQFGSKLFSSSIYEIFPQYLATYDIDQAYAYLHKSFTRTVGGLLKHALRFDMQEVKRRIAVLTGRQKDPFDTYHLIEKIKQQYPVKNYFFILFAAKNSRYDRGLNPENRNFQRLILQLKREGEIGCHPSFASAIAPSNRTLSREIYNLTDLTMNVMVCSRSHYLLLDFPETYQRYINKYIKYDFTLGYPELPGFRASTCKPFRFFDLSSDFLTPLELIPLIYMDSTLQRYMRLSPAEALETIKQLIDAVKAVQGIFVSLWHNESFEKDGHDWFAVYRESLDYFFADA